jgi:hypothetical protein
MLIRDTNYLHPVSVEDLGWVRVDGEYTTLRSNAIK